MAIVFHCTYCEKKIEAKDTMGGKWAKCPGCHNKIYVPAPKSDEEDELKLAPLDDDVEQKKQQLMAETFSLEQQILEEKESPEEGSLPPLYETSDYSSDATIDVDEEHIRDSVIQYLYFMSEGELDKADTLLLVIRASGVIAVKILDEISVTDFPPIELQAIPQNVLAGLIRTLRGQIS